MPKHETMLKDYILHHVCIYDVIRYNDIPVSVDEWEVRCTKYVHDNNLDIDRACIACFHEWLKEDL